MFRDPQVNLHVTDAEETAAFYRDAFGFRETFRTPAQGPPDHLEARLGTFVLGFATFATATATHGIDLRAGGPRAELVLWTDDVDRAYEHALAQGAGSLSPPHDFLGRLRAAWVADPEGN
ncbi:MAG: VOC family protein, partial [Solirubrobacteraceae bacterium]